MKTTYVAAAAVAVLAIIGVSAFAILALPQMYQSPASNGNTQSQSSALASPTGLVNFYIMDAPPSGLNLRYLLVNVTSITLFYSQNNESTTAPSTTTGSSSSSSTTSSGSQANEFVFQVPSSTGTNLNLTKLQGQSLLLGATNVPAGNVTRIVMNITGAEAFFTNNTSAMLKVVADGKLMVPVHFTVQPSGTANLTVDIQPSSIHISQGNTKVLTPVIHVTVVSQGNHGTTTESTTVTESESSSSQSS